jgi:hypothetical protein
MSVKFKIISDLTTAQYWWSFFSTDQSIFDTWEFRYCFYKYFNYELYFYVGYLQDEPIGLLPLQFNSEKGYLEFFGGSAQENNRVFIKPGFEQYQAEFYNQIDQKAVLQYISGEDNFTKSFTLLEYKYILSLKDLKDGMDYVEKHFEGKKRREILRRYKKMSELPVEIVINNFSDIELLLQWNIQHFKEESIFNWDYRKEILRDTMNCSFMKNVLTFLINGEKQGVSLVYMYRGCYVGYNSAMNPAAPADLSTYMKIKKIDQAIALGATVYDALAADCGWKEQWGFSKIPQYKFEKNAV